MLVAVMEVACGEYGDMVPPLVVAVQNNHCAAYQCQQKLTNCDKMSVATTTAVTTRPDHNTLQRHETTDDEHTIDDAAAADGGGGGCHGDGGDGENDADDVDGAVTLLHCHRRAVPTLVLANGDVSCDVTLLKEVSNS